MTRSVNLNCKTRNIGQCKRTWAEFKIRGQNPELDIFKDCSNTVIIKTFCKDSDDIENSVSFDLETAYDLYEFLGELFGEGKNFS